MKILKILHYNINNHINKSAGDWDDIADIPDIAEIITDDKKEKENPLCRDFWKYQVFYKPNINLFLNKK